MDSRPCPVCGSQDDRRVFAESNVREGELDAFAFASRKFPEYMHHRLVVCPACDLLYASPVPGLAELGEAYHQAAFDSQNESAFASRTYAAFLPEIARAVPDLKGALDVGAGDGTFVARLLETGFSDVVGVEPSAAPIAAADRAARPHLKQGLFQREDFREESLALVTCFQTLEHLHDPKKFCVDAFRLLKKGGALFLVCHNRRAVSARLLGKRSPIMDVEHLQLFSPESLRRLLAEAGFRRIAVRPIANRYPLYYWLKLFPIPMRIKRPLVAWLKETAFGRWAIPLRAGNMAAVAYK